MATKLIQVSSNKKENIR